MDLNDSLGPHRKSLTECLGYMFTNHMHSDIRFSFGPADGDPVFIEAHQLILAARSPVFETMIYGSLATDDTISISDISPSEFRVMLRYMYTDEASLTEENVIPLLYASNKYLLTGLSEKCLAFLEKSLDSDNVCVILGSAFFYRDSGTPAFRGQCQSLVNQCLKLIKPRANDVLANTQFAELPAEAIGIILPEDELVVEGEKLVYCACLKWAKRMCDLHGDNQELEAYRKHLGGMVLHIRFTVLLEELLQGEPGQLVADALENIELLSTDEKRSLERFKLTGQPDSFVRSLKMKRRYLFCVCERYDEVYFGEDGWKCEGFPDPVAFTCSEDIYLQGVGLYGPKSDRGSFTIKVTVNRHGDDVANLAIRQGEIETMSLQSTGQREPYRVYFPTPIFVSTGSVYTVYLIIAGQPSFFGRGGREKISVHGVTFSFISSSKKHRKNKTDPNTGQTPQLLFRL